MSETVENRVTELADLDEIASVRAPGELGRAQATLDEMVYFRDQNIPTEVMRLDAVMAGITESIKQAVASSEVMSSGMNSELEEQNRKLKSRISNLELWIADLEHELQLQKEASDNQNDILTSRLAVALKGRDDAVREVVRTRSRIEGMASEAEASAMFAEARVLVDRMAEDAFNDQALGELQQARNYLNSGRKELEEGNSGGAAYLFDLVSSLYEGFKVSEPRKVTIGVSDCALLSSPSASSKRINLLHQGEVVTGLETANGWIRVSTVSGRKGWVRKDHVH